MIAVWAALLGLGCLLLGFWVGYSLGRDALIQDEWERMRARWSHPSGKRREEP